MADFYEFTMAQALRDGARHQRSVFTFGFRQAPFGPMPSGVVDVSREDLETGIRAGILAGTPIHGIGCKKRMVRPFPLSQEPTG